MLDVPLFGLVLFFLFCGWSFVLIRRTQVFFLFDGTSKATHEVSQLCKGPTKQPD